MTIILNSAQRISGSVVAADTILTTLTRGQEAELVALGAADYVGTSPAVFRRDETRLWDRNDAWIAGDSLAAVNWSTVSNNFVAINSEGVHEWANAIAGRPLNITTNTGSGGETARDMLRDQIPLLIAAKPGYCFVSIGHNDLYNDLVKGARAFGRILDVINALLDAGITPIWSTVWARSYSATYTVQHLDCNERLKDWAMSNPCGIFWDGFAQLVDNTDANANGRSGHYYDSAPSIHVNNLGAVRLGMKLGALLQKHVVPRFVLPAGATDQTNTASTWNVLVNPQFSGSGGTAGAGVSGTVPTGWKVEWVTNTGGGTAVAAIVDVQDPDSLLNTAKAVQVTIGGTPAANDEIRITQDTGFNATMSGGNVVAAQCAMQVVSGVACDRMRTLLLVNNNEQTNWGNASQTQATLPAALSVVTRSRPLTVLGTGAASAARFDARMRFNGNSSGTVVRMWQPSVQNART